MIANYAKKQKPVIIKNNFYFIVGGILFFIFAIYLALSDLNVYKDRQKLVAQIEDYKKEVENIEKKNDNLRQGIAESDNNEYIEKIAREEFDLQKPGEKVVSFVMPNQEQESEKKHEDFLNMGSWTAWITQKWNEFFYGSSASNSGKK